MNTLFEAFCEFQEDQERWVEDGGYKFEPRLYCYFTGHGVSEGLCFRNKVLGWEELMNKVQEGIGR